MASEKGMLYVVATPIGNLDDMTPRAVRVLSEVDLIAAEDTRHSAKLLQHFGIATPTTAFHEHNEREKAAELVRLLQQGRSLALISDAGTPLVSDPGFRLVRAAQEQGIAVVSVPGACAAIAALAVSGLPTDRFAFEGFPPARGGARRHFFEQLARDARTLVFYESPHRIEESVKDMAAVFGGEREAVLARELTKRFETVHRAPLAALAPWLAEDENRRKGEFVVLVRGHERPAGELTAEVERVLDALLAVLPTKQAVTLAGEITGVKKNKLYQHALKRGKAED